jgi:hypothetical protein
MRFRAQLFTFLSYLAAVWLCGGLLFTAYKYLNRPPDGTPMNPLITGILVAFFAVTGVPLLLLFRALAALEKRALSRARRRRKTIDAN